MGAPTTFSAWASSGSIVVPSSGQQASGWADGQPPPAEYFNWYMNLRDLWIEYLATYPRANLWTYHGAVLENAASGPFASANSTQDASLPRVNMANGDSTTATFTMRIYPKFGDTIYAIGATGLSTLNNLSVAPGCALAINYSDPTTGAIDTVATAGLFLNSTTYGNSTYTLPTPHVVVNGAAYWLTATVSQTSGITTGWIVRVTSLGYESGAE
jgi:hypothetical protein